MATATFSIKIDMRTFAGYDPSTMFSGGGGASGTPTEYNIHYNVGFYEVVTGTGFSNFGLGSFPADGTVTGWELGIREILRDPGDPYHPIVQDTRYWIFSGLSVPADDIATAVNTDAASLAAYMPTMLVGNDTINGSAFPDYLLGYDGADRIFGNAGNDGLDGGDGADTLYGGLGNDTMLGGLGNDTYVVDSSLDKAIEDVDSGNDLVKSSVSFILGVNVEKLTLTGASAINGTGNSLANILTGNSAANTLKGGGGDDTLRGGGGDDRLAGGNGNDTLDGAAGLDQFLFDTALNGSTNHDRILNFSVADDTITLDNDIFTDLGAPGALDSAAFFTGSAAQNPEDRIIYNSATGNIYYDADGNGAGDQVLFAHVAAGTALTSADFLIVD